MTSNILFLCLTALLAGFVDAIVGGGGLIQLPAMLLLLPGVPMAACNILGSTLGARLALRRGTGFVRSLFLVVSAFILKLGWETWRVE